jgi:hypothetical protein
LLLKASGHSGQSDQIDVVEYSWRVVSERTRSTPRVSGQSAAGPTEIAKPMADMKAALRCYATA